jgi:hypothetical protein
VFLISPHRGVLTGVSFWVGFFSCAGGEGTGGNVRDGRPCGCDWMFVRCFEISFASCSVVSDYSQIWRVFLLFHVNKIPVGGKDHFIGHLIRLLYNDSEYEDVIIRMVDIYVQSVHRSISCEMIYLLAETVLICSLVTTHKCVK